MLMQELSFGLRNLPDNVFNTSFILSRFHHRWVVIIIGTDWGGRVFDDKQIEAYRYVDPNGSSVAAYSIVYPFLFDNFFYILYK